MGTRCRYSRGWPKAGLIAGALVLAVTADSTLAQDDADALDACSRMVDRDERLDCLDAVLAERAESSAREAPPPAAAPTAAPPAAPAAAPTAAPAAAPPAVESAEEQLSRRERRQRERERETQTVTIVDVQTNVLGHSTFTTADEQHWLSVNTPESGYPAPPFEADIEPGAGGSSFLRLPDRNRRLRVDRVE